MKKALFLGILVHLFSIPSLSAQSTDFKIVAWLTHDGIIEPIAFQANDKWHRALTSYGRLKDAVYQLRENPRPFYVYAKYDSISVVKNDIPVVYEVDGLPDLEHQGFISRCGATSGQNDCIRRGMHNAILLTWLTEPAFFTQLNEQNEEKSYLDEVIEKAFTELDTTYTASASSANPSNISAQYWQADRTLNGKKLTFVNATSRHAGKLCQQFQLSHLKGVIVQEDNAVRFVKNSLLTGCVGKEVDYPEIPHLAFVLGDRLYAVSTFHGYTVSTKTFFEILQDKVQHLPLK